MRDADSLDDDRAAFTEIAEDARAGRPADGSSPDDTEHERLAWALGAKTKLDEEAAGQLVAGLTQAQAEALVLLTD